MPFGQIRFRTVESELFDDDVIELLLVQHRRHLVDRLRIRRAEMTARSSTFVNSAILLRDDFGIGPVRTTHQHVGLQADRAQFLDRVLRRLRLDFAGSRDVGHERQMNEQRARRADFEAQLPDGLEKRLGFDVADRAADLDDDDVEPFAGIRGCGV